MARALILPALLAVFGCGILYPRTVIDAPAASGEDKDESIKGGRRTIEVEELEINAREKRDVAEPDEWVEIIVEEDDQ